MTSETAVGSNTNSKLQFFIIVGEETFAGVFILFLQLGSTSGSSRSRQREMTEFGIGDNF